MSRKIAAEQRIGFRTAEKESVAHIGRYDIINYIWEEMSMLQIENLTKNFDTICAVNQVSFTIPDRIVYGLLGTNGAGKSTLLRLIAGILQPDEGRVCVDGELCYENPTVKSCFFYLPDTPYYFANASMEDMIRFYVKQYPQTDAKRAKGMAEMLNLDIKQPLRTFSKGMKRQAFLILALCANTKYLLCDEVFDGLDPMIAEVMKKLLREAMRERELTVIVVSHKLRELEDICEQIGILHKGGVLSSGNMRERAGNICKFQCVLEDGIGWEEKKEALKQKADIVKCRIEGSFVTLLVRDKNVTALSEKETDRISETVEELFPVFCKQVPMTLEETFIAKMEENGYDIRKVLS